MKAKCENCGAHIEAEKILSNICPICRSIGSLYIIVEENENEQGNKI